MTGLHIVIAVVAVAVGALGVYLRARPRRADHGPPDDGLAGLTEATAALDGRMSSVHTMVMEVLKEQSSVGTKLDSNTEMTEELHLVLANAKHRGDWGEILAEDVLQHAGLQHEINYVRQRKLSYGSGRPDFTFVMPDGLELHLDAKFPLENFRRMEKAETDETREEARAAFVADIKRHIKALPSRGYADAEHTVGFVILFIANKGIFDAATGADPDVMKFALSHHVAICCPQTLMSVLLIARNAANALRVQRRTIDVLRCIEGFQSEWQKFITHVDKADRQLSTFIGSWENLKGTRRNQLQKRLDRIDELDIPDDSSNQPATDRPDAAQTLRADHLPDHPQAA